MSFVLTEAQLQALNDAIELQRQIDALYSRLDALVDPVAKTVAQEVSAAGDSDRERLEALLSKFPAGFHRTELRTLLIQKFGR
jgi:hypothetical protein